MPIEVSKVFLLQQVGQKMALKKDNSFMGAVKIHYLTPLWTVEPQQMQN